MSTRSAAMTPAAAVRMRLALALLGGWSIVPPYLGPAIDLELNVSSTVEVVDHVVPGVLVVLCAVVAALLARRGDEGSLPGLALIGVCFLAGLWQTVTHVPLLLDGGARDTPWDAVLLHSTPGPVVLGLSVWIFLRTPEPGQPAGAAP